MTYRDPLVSVVIATHNRAELVAHAIESVLRQTYARIECVVVDDGSTDNTAEVLCGVASRDSRVVCYRNTKNKGCAGARNTGLEVARGEYIAFLDDDDEYAPRKISQQVAVFNGDPSVDVVVSGAQSDWCDSQPVNQWVLLEFHPHRIFDGCNVMCRRAVTAEVRLRCNYMEWRDFAFQVYSRGLRVRLSSERLVTKGNSATSLSKDKERMFLSALANAQSYYEQSRGRAEHDVFRRYLANCHKDLGNLSLKTGRVWRAIQSYVNSYRMGRRLRDLVPFT